MAETETDPDVAVGGETVPDTNPIASDWRATIADDKARKYAEKFASPADAAKTAFEFRQKLSSAVNIPGKNATEEEIRGFHKKLGMPESPELYGVSVPEGLPEALRMDEAGEERLKGFLSAMHKAGATPAQVQTAIDYYYAMGGEALQATARAAEEAHEAAMAELRKEWGADYKVNMKYAERGARAFGGDGFIELLEKTQVAGGKLGNHPMMNRFCSAVGRRMGEGTVDLSLRDEQRNSLEEKRAGLTDQIHMAQANGDSAKAERLIAQREKLTARLYGDGPTG